MRNTLPKRLQTFSNNGITRSYSLSTTKRQLNCVSNLHTFHHRTNPIPDPLMHFQSVSKRRSIVTNTRPLFLTMNKGSNHDYTLFEEQLKELDAERTTYTNTTNSSSTKAMDTAMANKYEDELQEMNEERERLYGFTEQERTAWSKLSSTSNFKVDANAMMEKLHQLHASNEAKQHDTTPHDNDPQNNVFTHLTAEQTNVEMVDVGSKKITRRTAHAQCKVVFPPSVMKAFEFRTRDSNNDHGLEEEMVGPKGPIFATAKLAGIMGAKKTSDLIPLCHPLPLDKVSITIQLDTNTNTATIDCHCVVTHKTGVEMEAMTGASIAALTIYDMVKAVSHEVRITEVVLVEKQGGKRLVQNGVLLN